MEILYKAKRKDNGEWMDAMNWDHSNARHWFKVIGNRHDEVE